MPGTGDEVSRRRALLEQLASAEGADLYDTRGRRLGKFIEVVGDGEELAIRHDGALTWRRRVVSAATVADVLPGHGAHGAVVLDVDHKSLEDAGASPAALVVGEERHLLFVPTTDGYRLVEQDGPAPSVHDDVLVPDQDDAFRVIKVAASPLLGDHRLCAYLDWE